MSVPFRLPKFPLLLPLVVLGVRAGEADAPALPPPRFSLTPSITIPLRSDIEHTPASVRAPRVALDFGGMWTLDPRWRLGLETGIEESHYKFFNVGTVFPGGRQPIADAFRYKLSPTVIYGVNERWTLIGGASLTASGDAEANVGDALTYGGFFGARRQFTPKFALTFGVAASTRLEDDPRVLPLIGVDWQISRRWHLGSEGPAATVSYTLGDVEAARHQLFFRAAFESREYRFDGASSIPEGVLRDESFPVSLGWEWHPSPAATVVFQAGAAFNRSIEVDNRVGNALLDEKGKMSGFVSLAVRIGWVGYGHAGDASRAGKSADSDCDCGDLGGPVIQLWEENDSPAGTDYGYTQGLRVGYQGAEHAAGEAPAWLGWFSGLRAFGYDVERTRAAVTAGQDIFTPVEIHTTVFQPNDRPYVGWIYVGPSIQRRGTTPGGTAVLEELRVDLGQVGPGSLAGEAQNFIHRNWHIAQALGWENQIHNEFTGDLTAARAWRTVLAGDREHGGVEFIPHVALTGGTPRTQAAVGGLLRMGVNLPDDFGQPTIHSGLPSAPGVGKPFGVYLFAGIEGRAVARDTVIDGNLWRSSHGVESEPLALEGRIGAAVTCRRVDVGVTWTMQSRDWRGQADTHDYASVWLNCRL